MGESTVGRPKSGYLPSLDGWRALAVLGVMFTHDLPWSVAGFSNHLLKNYGGNGVGLFFAISGLLITTRILEEERLCGRFDIKGFYVRRILRIQPAAFFYLGIIGALMAAHVIYDRWSYWVAALLMYENFVWHPSAMVDAFFVGHFWTLAVEEHFYILLSLVLFFMRKHRLAMLAGIFVVLYLAHRVAAGAGSNDDLLLTARRTYWQLNFLIFPAMLAIALQRPKVKAWAGQYWKPWVAAGGCLALMTLHRLSVWARHRDLSALSWHSWGDEAGLFNQFLFALLVSATMLHGKSWTTRLLELRPLRFVGRISYSLYLWHVLFFFRMEAIRVTNPVLLYLSGERMKFVAAFAAATLSYYLLERPMMRLGHRLAPPARPGRQDLLPEPAGRDEGSLREEVKAASAN